MSDNRLVQIFEELRDEGLVRTKKEFAQALGTGYANTINAMSGNPTSLTPSMIVRAEQLLKRMHEGAPAPAPVHKEVTVSPDLLNIIATQAETIRSQQEVIARLAGVETKKGAV